MRWRGRAVASAPLVAAVRTSQTLLQVCFVLGLWRRRTNSL
jgi:hypothetical protein